MLVVAERLAALLALGAQRVQALLGAEARICCAQLDQLPGVLAVYVAALGLYIRAVIAADVGTLVVVEAHFAQRLVDQFDSAGHLALLVGVLYAQYEAAVGLRLGQQVGKQRRAQVAHVHIAGGTGRKTCAYHHWFLLVNVIRTSRRLRAGSLFDFLGPGVLERDYSIEYRRALARVGIHAEVAHAQELEAVSGLCVQQRTLAFDAREHLL